MSFRSPLLHCFQKPLQVDKRHLAKLSFGTSFSNLLKIWKFRFFLRFFTPSHLFTVNLSKEVGTLQKPYFSNPFRICLNLKVQTLSSFCQHCLFYFSFNKCFYKEMITSRISSFSVIVLRTNISTYFSKCLLFDI